MMKVTRLLIQELLPRLVDVVSEKTALSLQEDGLYFGTCPFHEEPIESFLVNSKTGIFKCMNCGVAGDVFSFIQRTRNVDFEGAVRYLAKKYKTSL